MGRHPFIADCCPYRVISPPNCARNTALLSRVRMPETVKQGYLEIREVATSEVVTAIELLSPLNKRSGEGPMLMKVSGCGWRGSSTHLVEIDLLRSGKSMPILNNGILSHYRILVRRGDRRPSADLYVFSTLQDRRSHCLS